MGVANAPMSLRCLDTKVWNARKLSMPEPAISSGWRDLKRGRSERQLPIMRIGRHLCLFTSIRLPSRIILWSTISRWLVGTENFLLHAHSRCGLCWEHHIIVYLGY